jgi:hypothetical protein
MDDAKRRALSELNRIRTEREENFNDHTADVRAVLDRMKELRAKMEMIRTKMAPLHEYAHQVRELSGGTETNYVVMLQAQLCKALHEWGILHEQRARFEADSEQELGKLRRAVSEKIETRSRIELDIMNRLFLVDNQKRTSKEEFEKKLLAQQENLEKLRRVISTLPRIADETESNSTVGVHGHVRTRRRNSINMIHDQFEGISREQTTAEWGITPL